MASGILTKIKIWQWWPSLPHSYCFALLKWCQGPGRASSSYPHDITAFKVAQYTEYVDPLANFPIQKWRNNSLALSAISGLSSASKVLKFHKTGLQLTINAHSKSTVWRTCLKLWLECGRLETTETEIFEPFKPNLNFFFQNAEPNQNKPHHDQPWA